MPEEVIRTGVDDLLDLLKKTDKISVHEAAKKLKLSSEMIQAWVDFLVEEEIVGVEYKFTKPIIYLNKPQQAKVDTTVKEEPVQSMEIYKAEFKRKAAEKNIPQEKISFFWRNHVKEVLVRKKDFFYREAKKRNLANVENLWKAYGEKLLSSHSAS
ncbi:hypothetical protein JXB28_05840 [Candidatus Woesearchaeota archaeon]|nr:hypothetical protein [Candidatus Woesearchaeota archaeon]